MMMRMRMAIPWDMRAGVCVLVREEKHEETDAE